LFASDIVSHKQKVKRRKNKNEKKENGGAEQKGIKE
jgi:hypothetical protein